MLRHYIKQAALAAMHWAFARREFKLLLRTTLSDINLRMQTVAATMNFFSTVVQPVVIRPPFGKSMLVVAPHQDDEAIGCGGILALQRRAGARAGVVVLHDGAGEHAQVSMTREALRDLRNEESRAAARIIGADEPIFFEETDLRGRAAKSADALREIIEKRRVDILLTPFVFDGNPDHRAANLILSKALHGIRRRIRVLQYEVWSNCIPNVVVVIDDVIQAKMEMLSCYKFANAALDYAHATVGLNMFHSRLLPAEKARYVEAFFEAPREEFVAMIETVEAAVRTNVRAGGPMANGDALRP